MNRYVLILLWIFFNFTHLFAQIDDTTNRLLSACQSNNLTAVQESLVQNANVNAKGPAGYTPLLYAVAAGNLQITELLLEKGANLNVNDPQGRCPVMIAVQKGNIDILKILAANGGDLSHRHMFGYDEAQTPLHVAVQNEDLKMVRYLLSEKISTETRNSSGESPLMLAARVGNLEMVKLLIENGAYLYADTGYGGSLLETEINPPPSAVKRYLQQVEQKRRSAIEEPAWTTLLKKNEMTGRIDPVPIEKYIQEGNDPAGKDKQGRTLLHYAAGIGLKYSTLLESLLAVPEIDINAADIHGMTPLHIACQRDELENVKRLLEYGASVDVRDYDQKTPLLILARFYYNHAGDKNEIQIARMLLDNGTDVNAADAFGNTPLLYLAEANMDKHLGFARLLIEQGADLDHQNYHGDTFLHRAADMGTATMMQLVIEAGANLNLRNYQGVTIPGSARYDRQEKIDLIYQYKQNVSVLEAAYYSQDDILEYLIGQGADINMTTNYDNSATALIIAAKRNDPTMTQTILKLGGAINAQDSLGNTALHYAAKFGHDPVVSLLLRNQADVSVHNKEGWRAVDLAGLENRRRVIQLFRDIYPDITPSREPMLAQQENPAVEVVEIVNANGNIDKAMLKKMLMEMSRHIDPNSSEIIFDPNTVEIQITQEDNNRKISSYTAMSGNPLHCAVIRGDTEKVKSMIKEGGDIHGLDDAGILPLNYAVLMENKPTINLLLKNGADINRLDENIRFGEMAGLMDFGHTIGEKAGWGAIHYATVYGNKQMVEFLIQHGANVDLAEIESGNSPIFVAVEAGHPDILKTLINAGANFKFKNKQGETILHTMARRGDVDNLRLLLDLGADIDVGKPGTTPLMTAARAGEDDAMVFLLEKGADINVLNKKAGDIVSSLVAASYTSETLKLLIEYGIDINAKNSKGQPPLFSLFNYGGEMKNGLRKNVQILLDAGLDINATDKEGNTILHYGAKKCSLELAQMMIDLGANVNKTNNEGKTPLDMMFGPIFRNSDYDDLFRLLAEKNTHLNDQDQYGRNALHKAVIKGSPDLVRFLASKGADIENRTNDSFDNRTPLHSAIRERHVDVIRTLLELGADLEARDNKQRTPLITAVWIDHVDSVRVLLDYQADCNAQDKNGQTPLHHALSTRGRHKEIIQLLLTAGARTDILDRNNLTPIELAQKMNKPEIMELFQ